MRKMPVRLHCHLLPITRRAYLTIHSPAVAELFGSLTVYLAGGQASFLRGRFVAANWDVDDLERHQEEIVAQGLLKGQAFKGGIGPGGHRFNEDTGAGCI